MTESETAHDADPTEGAAATFAYVIEAVEDPIKRWDAVARGESAFERHARDIRRRIALELKHERGLTWREVGEVCGGVSAQRAEQISRGV